jgi:ABC-type lipoprotein release transport system permease subunit
MGVGRLVIGLAWRNLRHRPWQALLLLIALSLSTTTVTLALALTDTGDRAWDRAFQATNGSHIAADADAPQDMSPAQREQMRADLAGLASAPGVAASGGPWQTANVDGEIDGAPIRLKVQVRDAEPAAVDQPLVIAGQWLDDRQGVVLEDGLAAAAGLQPGDTITIAGRHIPVRGAALTVATNPYPMSQPATVWISPATAARLGAALDDGGYLIELRLAEPDQAESFAATVPESVSVPAEWVEVDTWQDEKGESATDIQDLAARLGVLAAIVVGLTIATAAILVAGRMATQTRQVGTLKAVGVTPGQVTCVLLVEYLAVATVAIAVGLAVGTLLTPPLARLTRPLSVYGAQTPPITWPWVAIVVAVATSVVLFATVRPALRGVRHSTLRSLGGNPRPPRPAGPLIRAVVQLPLPLPIGLGLRAATRRRGRFVANTFGLTIGIALVIAGLALRSGVNTFRQQGLSLHDPDPISRAASIANLDRLSTLGFTIAAFLIALAVINAIIAVMFSAHDSARNHAIQRTLGTTPGQTVTAFLVAHVAACLLACAIGIPLGIVFYNAIRGATLDPIALPPLTYIATSLTALLLYTLIALTPARLLTRRPITPQLAYE